MCKKVYYDIKYNPTTRTWCLFKNIETEYGFNFYCIFESNNIQNCKNKLNEVDYERKRVK